MYNLVELLPKEDKKKIEEYVRLFGVGKHFIGVDEWLKYWSRSKVKLYKLLGENFTYKIPYKYEKPKIELSREFDHLIVHSKFFDAFAKWTDDHYMDEFGSEISRDFSKFFRKSTYVEDKIDFDVLYKDLDAKKALRLSKGMKPVKALSKIVEYFKNKPDFKDCVDTFEDFRLAHSRILNDKVSKGNLVLSIHPLDFITMSDNDYDWSSCMSWKNAGCYRVGTIEMMNSNNVICCYLEGKEPFKFGSESWANKKWRQLIYCNKDIAVAGKAYPYQSKSMTDSLLNEVKKLAKENLNWNYPFGIEEYADMAHVQDEYDIDRAKSYARDHSKYSTKKNIIFDSNGMYNDMLNDHNTTYWCVRKKVNHSKVYNYSGKCNCLCCNGTIISESGYDEYNDRFDNTGNVVCEECETEYFYCPLCDEKDINAKHYKLFINGDYKTVCEYCLNDRIRLCPCCGEPINIRFNYSNADYYIDISGKYDGFDREETQKVFTPTREYDTVKPVFMCDKCAEKMEFESRHHAFKDYGKIYGWNVYYKMYPYSPDNLFKFEKFFYENLKKVPTEDLGTTDVRRVS